MTAQRVQLEPAFVLHRRPYRETSWLLEVFGRDHGRVGLVARAARQARTRSGARLEPLQELLLSWTMRGDLGTLNQSEPSGLTLTLSGENLFSGLYLNELLLRLITRNDPHAGLFQRYRETLQALAGGHEAAACLRLFEKHLLQELGYGLNLDHDAEGQPIRAGLRYDYVIGHAACRIAAGAAARLEISGDSLLALRDERLDNAQCRAEARRLLRAALAAQLGDKPLKTPELFRSLRRLDAGRGKTKTATP